MSKWCGDENCLQCADKEPDPYVHLPREDYQTLRDERDRLLKIVEYGAAIDNVLFMRGEHVETYEARCRYLADRCRKLLAALMPAGGAPLDTK